MKAIIMMFDTLTRKYLSAYGNEWVHTPEFKRLEAHTVTFDNFYAASLPCMPARRDLHTGRCSFLHRMWGPLEPFDVSVKGTRCIYPFGDRSLPLLGGWRCDVSQPVLDLGGIPRTGRGPVEALAG